MRPDCLLSVTGLSHSFGGVTAIDKADFDIERGSITGLIGPNGSGKTTAVNVISGMLQRQQGRVVFDGIDIGSWRPYQIARRGLIRTFQISREFRRLTVMENMLVVAMQNHPGERLWNAILRPGLGHAYDRRLLPQASEVLDTFSLYPLKDHYAGDLSGGQKRLLELARAVMAGPKLLLLDEPMAGVNSALIVSIIKHLRRLRDTGITFLLVEHNLRVVEEICDEVVVMAGGRIIAKGSMESLRQHSATVTAYLGRIV